VEAPGSRSLPPLNALRAFEAAARHLSFTRAASELSVTQAAVSQQIRTLEEHLGVRLFRRQSRRLLLTDAGQILAPTLRRSLEEIRLACTRVRAARAGGRLSVNVTPYFSARWLAPRVGDFWEQHPEIELRLHHTVTPPDFARGDADAAVRWGIGPWPEVGSDFLFRAEPTPTFSPVLLQGPDAIRTPEDLRHHLLVHDNEDNLEGWVRWLESAGITDIDPRDGLLIDDVHVMVQAAVDGRAVAMLTRMMVTDHISAGRLVQPFHLEVSGFSYHLVYPADTRMNPNLSVFRDWLLEQAAAFRREHPAAARGPGRTDPADSDSLSND